MGITIVQKGDLTKKRPKAAKALILAGGAITGGSFKAGGLKALADYLVDFRVTDFDTFIGVSSGSLLAAPLMGGISPESILRSLDGTSQHFTRLGGWHYYRPNIEEFISRPMRFALQAAWWFPKKAWQLFQSPAASRTFLTRLYAFVRSPSAASYDALMTWVLNRLSALDFPQLVNLFPSGFFDNRPIESYIRENIERNRLTNDFRKAHELTGKRLYICAMTLDGARRVVFGPDENHDVTISQAVMASTAMPGFYRPAVIHGVAYVDGGVQETADIDIAVRKGAELIICYNPFRPYEREAFVDAMKANAKRRVAIAEEGIFGVLNQIFRAAFHARLRIALKQFERDPTFRGDIILIEPRADDVDFFSLNPLLLRNSVQAARLGFESVRNSIDERFDEIQTIMAAYGIAMSRAHVEEEYQQIARSRDDEEKIRRLLEGRRRRPRRRARP